MYLQTNSNGSFNVHQIKFFSRKRTRFKILHGRLIPLICVKQHDIFDEYNTKPKQQL